MGKQLTPELIIQRTKSDKFTTIKNLNLWGNDLEDVSAVKDLPNLEVLSLSVNHITTLKDFAACPKLTELYLRKNAISDLSEVQYLTPLKQLRVLWLWDNPCAETPNYRLIVIHHLPHLVKLDNTEITAEERETARKSDLGDGIVIKQEEFVPPREPQKKKYEPMQVVTPVVQQVPSFESVDERPISTASKPHHQVKKQQPVAMKAPEVEPQHESNRNENILCAVLALLKELDAKSLGLVKRDIDRKLLAKKI